MNVNVNVNMNMNMRFWKSKKNDIIMDSFMMSAVKHGIGEISGVIISRSGFVDHITNKRLFDYQKKYCINPVGDIDEYYFRKQLLFNEFFLFRKILNDEFVRL